MLDQELESQALRLAELRSERVRILGLLAFIAIFCYVLAFRHFLFHTTLYTAHTSWNFGLSFMIAVYEYLMLRLVDRAISKGEKFPKSLWVSSTILETCIPAIGIAWQSSWIFLPSIAPLPAQPHFCFSSSLFSRSFASIPGSVGCPGSPLLFPISPPRFI